MSRSHRVWPVAAALALAAVVAAAPTARAEGLRCIAPAGLTAIGPHLARSAEQLAKHHALKIVAVGSSSTEGIGASDPQRNYPNRLAAELKARFPEAEIAVINRGRGGEDVSEELARLARDVIAEHPDLVLWQLGTNAVLRRDDLAADAVQIRQGVDMLKTSGADVVLMDLQDAPRILERPSYATMEQLLSDEAEQENIGLFRRFALMRYWRRMQPTAAPAMIGPDGLHMTDASYGCLAANLAQALASNWSAPGTVAAARPGSGGKAVAGLAAGAIVAP